MDDYIGFHVNGYDYLEECDEPWCYCDGDGEGAGYESNEFSDMVYDGNGCGDSDHGVGGTGYGSHEVSLLRWR
jgi:hypothetical protein